MSAYGDGRGKMLKQDLGDDGILVLVYFCQNAFQKSPLADDHGFAAESLHYSEQNGQPRHYDILPAGFESRDLPSVLEVQVLQLPEYLF